MVTPTKKQKIMLDFVDEFVKAHGYSPTLREIMHALDYKSVSTVAKHVDNLVARGWLVKRDGEARSLELAGYEPDVSIDKGEHESWMKEIIRQKKAKGMTEEDRVVIDRAMKLLGLFEGGQDAR